MVKNDHSIRERSIRHIKYSSMYTTYIRVIRDIVCINNMLNIHIKDFRRRSI